MGDTTDRRSVSKSAGPKAAEAPKDQFLASLARCQLAPAFLRRFYTRFMSSSEEICHRFRLTDFDRQVLMLAASLRTCALAIGGDREGLTELNTLALSHDRYHHNAKPEWYDLWLEALVQTAAETDPEWSDELDRVWRHELGYVIQHMRSRY
jgi:hemoglobin-like flavoprotein